MFFAHPEGAWGSGGILRKRPGMIAYCALLRHPQSNLCGAGGSYVLDRRR